MLPLCHVCAGDHAHSFNTNIPTPMALSTWTTPGDAILGFPDFLLPHTSVFASNFNDAVRVLAGPQAGMHCDRSPPSASHVASHSSRAAAPRRGESGDDATGNNPTGTGRDSDACDATDSGDADEDDQRKALSDFRDMLAGCVENVTAGSASADDGRVRSLAALEYLALGLAATFASPGFMVYVRQQASRGSKVRLFASRHDSMMEILADQCEGSLLMGVCGLLLKRLNLVGLFSGLYGAENGRPLPPSFTCPKLLHWGLAMAVVQRRHYDRSKQYQHDAKRMKELAEVAAAIAGLRRSSSAAASAAAPPATGEIYTNCGHLIVAICGGCTWPIHMSQYGPPAE